jgi:hypothetical protein
LACVDEDTQAGKLKVSVFLSGDPEAVNILFDGEAAGAAQALFIHRLQALCFGVVGTDDQIVTAMPEITNKYH